MVVMRSPAPWLFAAIVAMGVVTSASADSPPGVSVPACALDEEHRAAVDQAASLALVTAPAAAMPRALRILLIRQFVLDGRDAHCALPPEAADAIGGVGICAASSVDPPTLACSSDAIGALTAADRKSGRPSPALLYVVAHEIGHFIGGDVGRFLGGTVVIDGNSTSEAKWNRLRRACQSVGDKIAQERESAADERAFEILGNVLVGPPYREKLISVRASLALSANQVRVAAKGIDRWGEAERARGAAVLPEYIADPKELPASDAEVTHAADRLLCDVLRNSNRRWRVPSFETDHPRAADRLMKLADRLQARAAESRTPAEGTPGSAIVPGNLDPLIGDLGGISAVLDAQYADFLRRLAPALCADRVNPHQPPACAGTHR